MAEFASLVNDMRSAQICCFRSRSRVDLDRAKRLEREVDEALAKMANQSTDDLFAREKEYRH